jgi:predicted O-methyltransferase YrrM
MEWEKPYMEKSIEILDPFGKVLEIGFGMGYSASKICSYEKVIEYNVIECNPIVWEKFENFKTEQKIKRPQLELNLIKGRWQDILIILDQYDCIYFDDYVLDEEEYNFTALNRVNKFVCNVLKNNTKIGSKISFYSGYNNFSSYKNLKCINIDSFEYKINIPDNCKYAKGDKMYIPLITKINEVDEDIDEKIKIKYKDEKMSQSNEKIMKEIERQTKYKKLFDDIQTRSPSCGLIVIDNFYNNAYETRKYVLTQEFLVRGNYPGQRTISYANEHLREIIQKYVEPFGGKITDFPIPKEDGSDAAKIYNGSFQFTTSRDRSWVHIDGFNNWAGVLYLTPNAPLSSGTSFYNFYDGTTCKRDMELLENKEETDKYSQDITKWKKVDQVGNVFNRLILFNSNRFHMSMDYFGDSKENGRLFQVFFFSTEK